MEWAILILDDLAPGLNTVKKKTCEWQADGLTNFDPDNLNSGVLQQKNQLVCSSLKFLFCYLPKL